jgi:hypothetical protein
VSPVSTTLGCRVLAIHLIGMTFGCFERGNESDEMNNEKSASDVVTDLIRMVTDRDAGIECNSFQHKNL